jgi:hypothetical protein
MCDLPESISASGSKKRTKEAPKGFCVKCKVQQATVSARQQTFCRSCFLTTSIQKFRQSLGRIGIRISGESKEFRAGIALSGGTGSRYIILGLHNWRTRVSLVLTTICIVYTLFPTEHSWTNLLKYFQESLKMGFPMILDFRSFAFYILTNPSCFHPIRFAPYAAPLTSYVLLNKLKFEGY